MSTMPSSPGGGALTAISPPSAFSPSPRSGAVPCPACRTVAVPDDGFCPECGLLLGHEILAAAAGSPLPYLIDANGRELTLRAGENVVGREGADILLPDKTVSRRHAVLRVTTSNVVQLEDLGSTNGTRHNDAVVAAGQQVTVENGAILLFGSVRVTLNIPVVAAPAPPPAVPALPPAPAEAPIAALNPPRTTRALLIGRDGTIHVLQAVETTFGRRSTNDILLENDAFVSGQHASIVYEGGTYRLVDLGSTNGTQLNGRKITARIPELLSDGDTIQFGQTQYTFQGPS